MESKFKSELKELVKADIITTETAQKIRAYYHSKEEAKPNRLFTIFGVLGALLSGLGIILIIAHNWDDMSRNLKTFLAFLPLLLGQVACAFSLIKKKGPTWIEASTTFLVLSVGATISLVSQIYNIPGNMSNFLFVWIAITAPLLYLLRSKLAIILHLVLITWYACNLGYSYKGLIPWWYLLFLAWTVPYYLQLLKTAYQSHIIGALNWLIPLSGLLVLGTFVHGDSLLVLLYLGFFGLLYNIGKLPQFEDQKLRRNGYTVLGSLGMVIILLIMTFEWFWQEVPLDTYEAIEAWFTGMIFLAATGILLYLFLKKQLKRFNLFQFAFLIVGVLFLTHWLGYVHNIILTNILVAALGLFGIRIGIHRSSYTILNYGLLIFTVLVLCRFFDSNLDFIFRGILFIAVGVAFFLANYLLHKKQRAAAVVLNQKPENNA